ncbi:MAG: dual CXXC motif small (seleno)protein [Thermodesulfobacteriota bacterium]
MAMQCKECRGKLEVARSCRRVRMRCLKCGREYQIHEVADQLDAETEEILARWTCIIYD